MTGFAFFKSGKITRTQTEGLQHIKPILEDIHAHRDLFDDPSLPSAGAIKRRSNEQLTEDRDFQHSVFS